ncbi:DUF6157 family protein [Larkinella harenae]
MKVHTTNYQDTFIAVADDCPATQGEVPPSKGDTKSVANLQFELLSKKPYQYTSDEVLFQVYARRNDLAESELATARVHFFSKGQPCFRASPLTKRYGWGIHYDRAGKMALVGVETNAYDNFSKDESVKVLKAMNTKRA